MVALRSPRGCEKKNPIDLHLPQTSYFIGPYNLHYLLFSKIEALLCHHPYCFSSQSQIFFGIGAGEQPGDFFGGKIPSTLLEEGAGGLTSLFYKRTFWKTHIFRDS